MKIQTLVFSALLLLPGFAAANVIPNDLSSDRAEIYFGDVATPILPTHQPTSIEQLFQQMAVQPSERAARDLVNLDPKLSTDVARRAVEAIYCAQDQGMDVDKVIVVDMNMEATNKRLWAFDIKNPSKPRLVINERVAHGGGSDRNKDGKADAFSNTPDSHMTSLGLYKISERYKGRNGWSRRLDGLFAKFNGKARDRAVVMHPSKYVSAERVGRSQGCPAVSQTTMNALEDAGLKNAVLWIDGPDKTLAQEVADCAKKRQAQLASVRRKEAFAMHLKERPVLAYATQIHSQAHDRLATLTPAHEPVAMLSPGITGSLREPIEQATDCELTVPRTARLTVRYCSTTIETMAIGHTLI